MQLFVSLKSVGLAPLTPIAVTFTFAVPVLVRVTGSVLLEPTSVDGKLSDVADKEIFGTPITKDSELEVPPPGVVLTTVIVTVPGVTMSLAEMATCNSVELT